MTPQPQTRAAADIATRDLLIASDTPGIELFLRNKREIDREAIGSILFVHGATFSSVSLFDVDMGGGSLMEVLARAGIDTWALDVRGYGGSTRPNAMSHTPTPDAPLVQAVEAVGDVARAIAHIRSVCPSARLGLLGMSWGGSLAGMHASQDQDLAALILVAPLWLSATPLRFDGGAPILTHREVAVAAYQAAWVGAAPEDRRADLLPSGWFERWSAVTEATDAGAPQGYVRAPSGAVADVRQHWTAGRPLYDPARITAPTLVLRGTWDVDVRRDMALDLFDRLANAKKRAYVELAGATHMMLMEPAKQAAFDQIVAFASAALSSTKE